ncbi:MAG: lysine--tRNA ligase, partial [Thiomonas sp. 20-64-5]
MNTDASHSPASDDSPLIAERRAKLSAWRHAGPAFPNDFKPTHQSARLQAQHGGDEPDALDAAAVRVRVAGRMMLKRVMGKASFATLQDSTGRIQIHVSNDVTGEDAHTAFKHDDLGDWIGCEGVLFKTRTGELTIRAEQVRLLVKSLRPLPDKFHGLEDLETRYRQRYVDLIVTPESRERF